VYVVVAATTEEVQANQRTTRKTVGEGVIEEGMRRVVGEEEGKEGGRCYAILLTR